MQRKEAIRCLIRVYIVGNLEICIKTRDCPYKTCPLAYVPYQAG